MSHMFTRMLVPGALRVLQPQRDVTPALLTFFVMDAASACPKHVVETERTNTATLANEAQYDDVRRLDAGADVMRSVRNGGVGYSVPVQLAATPAPATVRQFVGLSPENR